MRQLTLCLKGLTMTDKSHDKSTRKNKLTASEIDDQIKQKAITKSKAYTNSVMAAALTIDTIYQDRLDVSTLVTELSQSVSTVNGGNTREIEAMLMTQTQTLNALFHCTLQQIAHTNMINQIQVFSDIALRAQNQSRKTLAVLAELKHPRRTTFIKHQNNAINQQVNNTPKPENFKNLEKIPNELVSEATHEKMDIGTASQTISNHTPAEALATLHRATVTGR